MLHIKYILVTFIFFCLTQVVNAQSLLSAKDTAVLSELIEMPEAAPQFNLSFSSRSFDSIGINNFTKKIVQNNIQALEDSLEQIPHDVNLILSISQAYYNKKDVRNYEVYLQYAFKNAMKAYENNPDSFEVVRDLVGVLTMGGNQQGILQVYEQFVMAHPKHTEALSMYAMQLALAGQLQKANHLVEQAQKIDPMSSDVYLAAMMCEVSKTLIQLSDIMSQGGDDESMLEALNALEVDAAFFEQSLADGAPQSAQKALDATRLILIYYRTVIPAASAQLGEEKIALKPIKKDLKTLSSIEKRAKNALKSNSQNPYFYHKALTTCYLLRGKVEKALQAWQESGKYLENDVDILRLMALGYFLQMDYDNTIAFLVRKNEVSYSFEDNYALGRIYVYNNQLKEAQKLYESMLEGPLQDPKIVCAHASVLFQMQEFEAGAHKLLSFSKNYKDTWPDYLNYFMAIAELIVGASEEACEGLKSLDESSDYYGDAKLLLQHFCK